MIIFFFSQLISSYLKRASDEERSKFMRVRGFNHLANQIALYPASLSLAEACLNLITPCLVSLDDQNFVAQMELTGAELVTLPPLLALLPRSVHDTLLTHHIVNVLRAIFCKVRSMREWLKFQSLEPMFMMVGGDSQPLDHFETIQLCSTGKNQLPSRFCLVFPKNFDIPSSILN